jgi:hypothetical protein
MKATETKLGIINVLGETTTTLKESEKELIENLFELKYEAEEQINSLCESGLIDASDWGITYLKGKSFDYMMYDGKIITDTKGGTDGGNYNHKLAPTNYPKLVEFVLKSADIIKGMQDELQEKIEKINAQL